MQNDKEWEEYKKYTLDRSFSEAEKFQSGAIRGCLEFWKSITNNPVILNKIAGTIIDFNSEPKQDRIPVPYVLNRHQTDKISEEVEKLLVKNIIQVSPDPNSAFISNIFTREKQNGQIRIILDLTELNEYVEHKHFKMDTLQTALNLISKNCYLASIDLKDAYHSVPIAKSHRKYLSFIWNGVTYQYTCLPNGLSAAPRYFTMLTRVLFQKLRERGHISTTYIDDCLLISPNMDDAKENVKDTIATVNEAGFTVHPEKSVLEPRREITYLGFVLNSASMKIRLTDERAERIIEVCNKTLKSQSIKIRQLAKAVGLMVAAIPGVKYGKLRYRRCDNFKRIALARNHQSFNAKIVLSDDCKKDLRWWARNIAGLENHIISPEIDIVIETDASLQGWGACIKGNKKSATGGKWSQEESKQHINELELKAAWLAILSYGKDRKNHCFKILSDNVTTVAYLNNMGGTKKGCNEIARDIWKWCESRNNFIIAAHIPGKSNEIADKMSRSLKDNMEWKLNADIFKKICDIFGRPEIDLFASRINKQVVRYFSWKPDPDAEAVDALSENWKHLFFYAFPPFNMINRVLNKVERDDAKGIIVVPYWSTQSWFPKFVQMCTMTPIMFHSQKKGEYALSHPRRDPSELPKNNYMVGLVSRRHSRERTFQSKQGESSWRHGEMGRRNSIRYTLKSGTFFVQEGKWKKIPQI